MTWVWSILDGFLRTAKTLVKHKFVISVCLSMTPTSITYDMHVPQSAIVDVHCNYIVNFSAIVQEAGYYGIIWRPILHVYGMKKNFTFFIQEQKEQNERRQREKQERQAEEERLKREALEREEEKQRKEVEEMKLKKAQDRLEALKKTPVGAKALADVTAEVGEHALCVGNGIDAREKPPNTVLSLI